MTPTEHLCLCVCVWEREGGGRGKTFPHISEILQRSNDSWASWLEKVGLTWWPYLASLPPHSVRATNWAPPYGLVGSAGWNETQTLHIDGSKNPDFATRAIHLPPRQNIPAWHSLGFHMHTCKCQMHRKIPKNKTYNADGFLKIQSAFGPFPIKLEVFLHNYACVSISVFSVSSN